jgi:hypothetical protein
MPLAFVLPPAFLETNLVGFERCNASNVSPDSCNIMPLVVEVRAGAFGSSDCGGMSPVPGFESAALGRELVGRGYE